MSSAPDPSDLTREYDFQFDSRIEPVFFGAQFDLEGWLLHQSGEPIHGIRVLVKRRFSRPKTIPARRKRNRPEVAAAYPHLPDALASGFLLEMSLRFGFSDLVFQVRNHERVWKTFYTARVFALPFSILARLGLSNLRRFLIFYVRHVAAKSPATSSTLTIEDEPGTKKAIEGKTPDGEDTIAPEAQQTRIRLFATSKSNLFIVEIGQLVAAGFRDLGFDTELLLDQFPETEPAANTLQIVVTPHEFYNLFLREHLSRTELRKLTHNLFLLCTEQPETGWFQSNLQWGIHARGVADISPLGVAAYRNKGLRCYHLQLGYHDILAHHVVRPHQERNVDITFLGSMTQKRELFFAENAEFFAERSCHLRLVPLGFAKTKMTRSYLSSEARNELLSRSRILLNVHYSDQPYFEWHRMLVALANGCCVITETCEGYGALQPGKHFIMVEPEYLISCCEYYLAHPEECERIAWQGMKFIQTHLRQDQTCRIFLEQVKQIEGVRPVSPKDESGHKSALGSIDTTPYPLPAQLGRTLLRRTARLFGDAVAADLRKIWMTMRNRSPDAPVSQKMATQEPLLREQVIQKREASHDRWVQQEEMRQKGDPVLELYDNAAFNACEKPELSVLITLYNYSNFIGECLAAVEKAAQRLGYPCEVLIVNDASTDHSLERALHCQRRSALPIRVVNKKLNTGLADTRNIALELARAPYVFILDADNLIYPNALQQLHAAITSDNYAAAYSLLCRFQGTPRNRVGLLSHFDWDPEVLVQFPYIDAMAMFRRDVLREAPGYDHQLSQIGWFGWEDYDMWLRFAQKQHPVAFVPNILCLYRHHRTSMINTTILFRFELGQHFLAKYGGLLDQFEPREHLFGIERAELFQTTEKEVLNGRVGKAG